LKIQSTGGFGNQLFQWSYAHHLKLQEADRKVVVFRDAIHTADRESHLGLIANKCFHGIQFGSSDFTGRVLQALDKSATISPHFYRTISTIFGIVTEIKPKQLEDFGGAKSKIVRGFFQYPQQMPQAVMLVLNELESTISSQVKLQKKSYPYQLAHIRRRDFVDNKDTYGVLSIEYYRRALSEDLPMIIIGDEEEPPIELLGLDKTFEYINPKECNEYEAMFLALNCERFIMANSTFSWWCGLLAANNENQVLIPTPWTKMPQVSANYEFPGFTPIESSFI
jgi:hypothetical protein